MLLIYERKNKMFLNQGSSFTLQAKLTGAVVSSPVEISVTYTDNTGIYHSDVILPTNDLTPVVLLSAPPENTVNIVESIKIYNPDTQSNTIQILAGDKVVYTCTAAPGESLILSEAGASNSINSNALAQKADDNKVVHLTGTENITGDKTFAGGFTSSGTTTIGAGTGIVKTTSGVVNLATPADINTALGLPATPRYIEVHSINQSFVANTLTKVNFSSITYDTLSEVNLADSSITVSPNSGANGAQVLYEISVNSGTSSTKQIYLYGNGALWKYPASFTGKQGCIHVFGGNGPSVSEIVNTFYYLTSANETVTINISAHTSL